MPPAMGAWPTPDSGVKPQKGAAADAGAVASMHTTPAVWSADRVTNTNTCWLCWSTHRPGWLDVTKSPPEPSVIVLKPLGAWATVQQFDASDWLWHATSSVGEWWKTLKTWLDVSPTAQ